MALNFCANLSYMFQERDSILERYSLAKQNGFKAVECNFLFDHPVEEIVQVKQAAGVEQVQINTWHDQRTGVLGFAAVPGQQEKFRQNLQQAVTYCKALDCKLVHILAGKVANPNEENDKVYMENLLEAESLLRRENIVGIIEPINNISFPGYYLDDYRKGLEVVKKLNSPYIKLLADLFHFQMMKVDLASAIREALPFIGHVQVAQAPNCNEPGSPGEIDYKKVFSLLESLGYKGWIGLEYYPTNETSAGLKWVKEMGYSL